MSHRRLRLCVVIGALVALVATGNAMATSNLVISQVYGGGGNAGASFTHDYIEIFNRGKTLELLDGWSLQYGSSTGLIGPNAGQITPLSGFISPADLHAFVNQVEAQSGKSLTAEEAATLAELVKAL